MFCSKCGAKLPDFASFCYNCGEHVLVDPKAPSPPLYNTMTKPFAGSFKHGMLLSKAEYILIIFGAAANALTSLILLELILFTVAECGTAAIAYMIFIAATGAVGTIYMIRCKIWAFIASSAARLLDFFVVFIFLLLSDQLTNEIPSLVFSMSVRFTGAVIIAMILFMLPLRIKEQQKRISTLPPSQRR